MRKYIYVVGIRDVIGIVGQKKSSYKEVNSKKTEYVWKPEYSDRSYQKPDIFMPDLSLYFLLL